MRKIVIGSRDSRLAVVQSEMVRDFILEKHPDIQRVAVAFSFQMFDQVPTEPTDICPQILVTEEETCCLTSEA